MNEPIGENYIDTEAPSKTQRKKRCAELETLGAELSTLSDDQLEFLPLSEELKEQLAASRLIKKFGARKRQIKHIGGLLRGDDIAVGEIRESLDRLRAKNAHAARDHHRIEAWRDRLLSEGDCALNDLMAEYPQADRQQLRQLMRKAVSERVAQKAPASARKLYKVLRDILLA